MTLRRLVVVTHRDVGYFVSGLVLVYCLSGLALNHVGDWDPDFVVVRRSLDLPRAYTRAEVTPAVIAGFGALVGEGDYKLYDFPTEDQVKVYYDDASLAVDLGARKATYERVTRRPVFYQANVLHRNSVKRWRWASDVFAALLVALDLTGLFVLRGKEGLAGRGKWFVAAGVLPPLAALALYELLG